MQQGLYFTLISGCGWCFDFGLYLFATICLKMPVGWANLASSLVSVTFVFVFATWHIFARRQGNLSLRWKYVIYLGYQVCLVSVVSYLAQKLFQICIVSAYAGCLDDAQWKALVKCLVTPLTLCCNFVVMKYLTERI